MRAVRSRLCRRLRRIAKHSFPVARVRSVMDEPGRWDLTSRYGSERNEYFQMQRLRARFFNSVRNGDPCKLVAECVAVPVSGQKARRQRRGNHERGRRKNPVDQRAFGA